MKLVTIIGARPQFVKASVISREIRKRNNLIEEYIVHTGQHYDQNMSEIFFKELNIPKPFLNLNINGSGEENMMSELREVLKNIKPAVVLVYGDTNSTLAAAIVSSKLNIPLIHVEGGERIYRRKNVPEEINRVVTDHLSSKILTCTKRALSYLDYEGLTPRSKFVGDPMFDLFKWSLKKYESKKTFNLEDIGLETNNFHLATLHRVENTSSAETLFNLLGALQRSELKVLLPIHPRVKKIIQEYSFYPGKNLIFIDPVGYFDFQNLILNCRKVFTDSGGVTREAYFAKKHCIIPMKNSWWSEVVDGGWAHEVGRNTENIVNFLNAEIPNSSLNLHSLKDSSCGVISLLIEEP